VPNWITQCTYELAQLKKLAGNCYAPPGWGGCNMAGCSHNCGIYLCNDNAFAIEVPCQWIWNDAWDIIYECSYDWNEYVSSVKGQKFLYTNLAWGFNVIVKENFGCK